MAGQPLLSRFLVLALVAVLMTMGVYGLVGAIVKMDDAGLYLSQRGGPLTRGFGRGLLLAAPKLMRTLSVLGTAAMFLVGGGILLHGVPALGHAIEHWTSGLGAAGGLVNSLAGAVAGLIAGAALVFAVQMVQKMRGKSAGH